MNRSGWSVIDRSADIPMCGRRSSVDYLESNLPVRTYTSVPGTSRAWIEDRKSIAGRKYRRYLHVIISEEVRRANNTRWRARVITDGFHPPSHPPRRPVCKFPSPVGDIFYFFFFFFSSAPSDLIKNHGSRRPAQRGRDTGIHCLVIAVKRRGNEVSTPRESNVWLTREGRFLIFSVKQRFVIGPDSDAFARHACIMGWQCFFPPFYFILFRIFLFRVLPLFSFIFSPSSLSFFLHSLHLFSNVWMVSKIDGGEIDKNFNTLLPFLIENQF